MSSEQKKLVYKKANGTGGGNLQTALVKALAKYDKPSKRVEKLGADGSQVRFINVHRKHQQLTIGMFHKVTQGASQSIIEMGADFGEWKVERIRAAKTDPKLQREFIEGTLMFAIWKDHVILHQTNACRADQFEGYCTWLLSQAATSANPNAPVPLIGLADPLPPHVRQRSKQPVRKLNFGGSLQTTVAGPKTQTRSLRFTPFGPMWDAIKAAFLMYKADVPDDLKLEEALGEGDIHASIELRCTKKKAETTAGQILSALGQTLRHSDAPEYTVELADGSKITSQEMKIERMCGVECVDKQPVPESMFKAMAEWMQVLVNDGIIIDDEPFGNT